MRRIPKALRTIVSLATMGMLALGLVGLLAGCGTDTGSLGTVVGPDEAYGPDARVVLVALSGADRVVSLKDPYPPASALEPGETVRVVERDEPAGISSSLVVDSVDSDDTSAVAAQERRQLERNLDDMGLAIRTGDSRVLNSERESGTEDKP